MAAFAGFVGGCFKCMSEKLELHSGDGNLVDWLETFDISSLIAVER
jgi:hypothetical protein